MIVQFLNENYECAKAVKGADYIHLFDANGNCIASFDGISDFSLFTIDGGEWTTPEPTQEERIAELEAQNRMLTTCLLEMSEVVYA